VVKANTRAAGNTLPRPNPLASELLHKPNTNKRQSKAKTQNGQSGAPTRNNSRAVLNQGEGSLLRRLMSRDFLPAHLEVALRYTTIPILTSDATPGIVGTEQTWRLNSLFDPDLTSTGHQPYGFDNLTPIFGSYQVRECLVELEFSGSDSITLIALVTVQSGQNTTALAGSQLDFCVERQSVMSRPLPIAGNDTWRFRENFPIHSVVGLTKTEFDGDPNYRALVSTNPATQSYLRVAVGDAGTGVSKKCVCKATLTFKARLFDRKTVATS
jgi:hypothetical protein